MERLTIRNSEGIGVLKQPYQCERCGDLQWSLPDLGNGSPTDRLAEYEDIGLLPEQIKEIDSLYAEKCKELTELQRGYLSGLELLQIWAELEKLKEYRHLEEQGKLLRLPCTVGDTVWDNDFGKACSYTVTGFSIGKIDDEENDINGLKMYYRNWNGSICCSCAVSEIGKTVFLTREEA